MIEKEPSWTARVIALYRGMHILLDDDPKIYEDTLGRQLANLPEDEWKIDDPDWHEQGPIRLRTHVVCRSRFVEDCLNDNKDISQLVILGAGLDSFAYRQPENAKKLTIFEVDHPASQNWKRRRLSELDVSIPHNVHYVPVDFEHQQLNDELAKISAFNRNAPTLFSFLGIIYYLPKAVALNTFKQIRASVDGFCQIAMDVALSFEVITHDEDRDELQGYIDSAGSRGEPWVGLYTPDEIVQVLKTAGFEIEFNLSPMDIHERYSAGRSDKLTPSGVAHLVSAISAS